MTEKIKNVIASDAELESVGYQPCTIDELREDDSVVICDIKGERFKALVVATDSYSDTRFVRLKSIVHSSGVSIPPSVIEEPNIRSVLYKRAKAHLN